MLAMRFPVLPGSQRSIRKQIFNIFRKTENVWDFVFQHFQDHRECWELRFSAVPGSQINMKHDISNVPMITAESKSVVHVILVLADMNPTLSKHIFNFI